MEAQTQPKVILFDIGGVVAVSPFQSILDYELSLGIPAGWVNYSISKTAPDGFWHRLETGSIPLNDAFYEGFSRDLSNPELWTAFYEAQKAKDPGLPEKVPPVPKVDAKWLFHDMMLTAAHPDPWMFPALKNLRSSGKYILAALSNTVIFPPGHKLHRPDISADPVRGIFDCFVSSAHVGLRKPDPRIYQLAVREVNKFAHENAESSRGRELGWADGVKPGDVVFLDDIGQNLKAGREAGFRTIKVNLGRTFEAVEELERITGLKLAADHPKIPIKPRYNAAAHAKL
ncbi:Acyl-CoA dehydrogenase family member 10 [Cytospora mali]|uniref:Acyl-CoA dehydrogenase family member 10 n=1 Tax=Cytospora mali TaxID=578113 RepID=A0A194VFW0_CYTMA|nr:Acyl-CoA dehydrogenase family member 10 [Valsa mali var. pyri (nom. inval.)]